MLLVTPALSHLKSSPPLIPALQSLSGKRSAKPTGLADLQHNAGPTRSKPAAAGPTPAAYDPAEVPEDWKSSLFEAAQQKCSAGGTAAGTAADRAFGGFQATHCSPAAAAAAAASAQQQPSGGVASQVSPTPETTGAAGL